MPNSYAANISNLDYGQELDPDSSGNTYWDPVTNSYQEYVGGGAGMANYHEGDLLNTHTNPIHALMSRYQSGSSAYQAIQPYDLFDEKLSFNKLERSLSDSMASIEAISREALGQTSEQNAGISKSGFAGSGLAVESQDYIEAVTASGVSQARNEFRGNVLGHMIDVRKSRQGYIDELWGTYNSFLKTNPSKVASLDESGLCSDAAIADGSCVQHADGSFVVDNQNYETDENGNCYDLQGSLVDC